MRLLAPLLVLLAATGCLDAAPTTGTEAVTGDAADYRFIHLVADVTIVPPLDRPSCEPSPTPEIDLEGKRIRFHDVTPGRDFAVLLLTVTRHDDACGTVATSWATMSSTESVLTEEGADGTRTFSFDEEGRLLVDGVTVPPGGSMAFARRGTLPDGRPIHQEVVVHDRGMWPRAGLTEG